MAIESVPVEIFQQIFSLLVPKQWCYLGRKEQQAYLAARLVCRKFDVLVSQELMLSLADNDIYRYIPHTNHAFALWLLRTKLFMGWKYGPLLSPEICASPARKNAACEVLVAQCGTHWVYKLCQQLPAMDRPYEVVKDSGGILDEDALLRSQSSTVSQAGLLSISAYMGDAAAVAAMISEQGVDPNSWDNDFGSPLYAAAYAGQMAVVRQLVDAGADVSACTGSLGTAVMAAAFRGHTPIVAFLVSAGAETRFLINAAVRQNHEALFDYLMTLDAVDINATDMGPDGQPFLLALSKHRRYMARQLAARPDIKTIYGYSDRQTLVHKAVRRGWVDVALILLENPEIDLKARDSQSAFQLACFKGLDEVVEVLLARPDVDPNYISFNLNTGLVYAMKADHDLIVRTLLARPGVNASLGRGSDTPLVIAASGGWTDIVNLLLERPEVKKSSRTDFSTAQKAAAESGHHDISQRICDVFSYDPMKDQA